MLWFRLAGDYLNESASHFSGRRHETMCSLFVQASVATIDVTALTADVNKPNQLKTLSPMTQSIQRREFIAGSLAAAMATSMSFNPHATAADDKPSQEIYEWRIYRCASEEMKEGVSKYVERAYLPALNRLGIDRVGVFTSLNDDDDHSVYVLIPYSTLDALTQRNSKLAADQQYLKAAAEFSAPAKDDAPFVRIESRLMKAFAGMPVIELPAQSKKKQPRLFELRIYESHNEKMARRKVEMFNEGEIDIMRDVKLGPVFFGETLISNDVPNLTYMLSAGNDEAHKEHWNGFRKHPEWLRMKVLERYKGTVSKITSIMLAPTAYSQI